MSKRPRDGISGRKVNQEQSPGGGLADVMFCYGRRKKRGKEGGSEEVEGIERKE